MKSWRSIAVAVGWLLGITGYVYGVIRIYSACETHAIKQIADTKAYRMTCPSDSLLHCTFTEVPVKVNQLTDVIIPTAFWSLVLLATIVGVIWGLASLYIQPVQTPDKPKV